MSKKGQKLSIKFKQRLMFLSFGYKICFIDVLFIYLVFNIKICRIYFQNSQLDWFIRLNEWSHLKWFSSFLLQVRKRFFWIISSLTDCLLFTVTRSTCPFVFLYFLQKTFGFTVGSTWNTYAKAAFIKENHKPS